MKTIFELTRIYTSSKAHYPLRKTRTYDLGLFSTLAKAESQMGKDVEECQKYECERLKDISENEEYREDEKRFGHDIVYSLGEGDTHFHPESPLVFRPTKPVSKALREKLRSKLEEMKRRYES